jgi:DNA-binding transcriptional ArsR family regulator
MAKTSLYEMRLHAEEVSTFLKTLANENRLIVLCALLEGEQSVSVLNRQVDLSPSALSQHLASLRDAKLVSTRRESQTIYYRIEDPRVMEMMVTLKKLFCP